MSDMNCGTGCRDPKHLQKCSKCGAEYHYGIEHQCSTSTPPSLCISVWKPLHAHCAWFGSELACKECNPICWDKHQMDNPNHLQWCGAESCPMNPERFRKKALIKGACNVLNGDYKDDCGEKIEKSKSIEITPQMQEEIDAWERVSMIDWAKTAEEDLKIAKEFENCESDIEEEEDNIRKSKRKTIRNQGKYKSRGKEKRREP